MGGGGGSFLRAECEDGAEVVACAGRGSIDDRRGWTIDWGILAARGEDQRGGLRPRGKAPGEADGAFVTGASIGNRVRRCVRCDRGGHLPCHACGSPGAGGGGAMKRLAAALLFFSAVLAAEPRLYYSKYFK